MGEVIALRLLNLSENATGPNRLGHTCSPH
jgi:hypothetical protein